MIFCDDRYWVSKLGQHLNTAARDPQFSLDGLVWIGDAAQHQRLRLPPWRFQFRAQQFRGIGFHHYFAFEIEAGRKPEILVCRPRVTINAAVLAPAIRIQARFESDVRTRIAGDNRFRSVAKILRRTSRCLFGFGLSVDDGSVSEIDMEFFKSIGGTPRRAAAPDCRTALRRFDDQRLKLLGRRHGLSSHEHITASSKSSHQSINPPRNSSAVMGVMEDQSNAAIIRPDSPTCPPQPWRRRITEHHSLEGWQSG
jgi:hypothetical protein